MNAKVKISTQPIPFYAAPDALNAYTAALNVAVQIRTLINQITKSAIQVKGCAVNSGINPTVFSELENITSIGKLLVDSQISTYEIECNRHQDHKKQYKEYDAGDLFDAFSLAYENTAWLQTLFCQAINETELAKAICEQSIHSATFSNLEHLIRITEHVLDIHTNTFNVEREKYEIEWEATKNA